MIQMMTAVVRLGKPVLIAGSLITAVLAVGFDRSAVRVDSTRVGPRPLEEQTQSSVVRDYLGAWKTLSSALEQNRASLLDSAFVGTAKDRFAETIRQQQETGLQTQYRNFSHNIDLAFYSPEGMSIQLVDMLEYDLEIVDNGHVQGTQHVRSRYIAVLTPTEVRWKVRILQAEPE